MSPSPFVVEWVGRLAHERGGSRRALDVAMGLGRHALPLARAGFTTFGVDIKHDVLVEAVAAAAKEGVRLRTWCADLTTYPLPAAHFDLIVVSRYLQRDLFAPLQVATAPGGVVLYETFTTAQLALGSGPRSPDHLLEPGELRRHFDGFEILFHEESTTTEAVARIAARRQRSLCSRTNL